MFVCEGVALVSSEHQVWTGETGPNPLSDLRCQSIIIDLPGDRTDADVSHVLADRMVVKICCDVHGSPSLRRRAVARSNRNTDIRIEHLSAPELAKRILCERPPNPVPVRVSNLDAPVAVVLPVRLVRMRIRYRHFGRRIHEHRVHTLFRGQPRAISVQSQRPSASNTGDRDVDRRCGVRSLARFSR